MTTGKQLTRQDRKVINGLQGGFPVCERPFQEAALQLGMSEDDLIERLTELQAARKISRFAPLYNAERLGGAVTLAALAAPPDRFDEIAAIVNAHPEIAHNYERSHHLNMWFVVACEAADRIPAVLARIEDETGCPVFDFPKSEEYFIEFKVDV